ncbi:diacylglycerol kinase [Rheinheimera sp. MMS21-TC3]|uniref:diacylglycerol kinase n=1 Tax=Rheinheimera sp. MMS21-TC3 TaxID=3072790 RepID=UPI0028C39B9C|nr:diacylglycerol kinase [Rheinheimera sp. MMS21-TC3]WNO60750.1 diacylglycerol kinase [Rheinheimera sp. MMS21-TC3]
MNFEPSKKPIGLSRILLAFKNSCRAFNWLIKNEVAVRQEIILLVINIVLISIWSISVYEKLLLLCAVLFLLFAEVINTAIEVTIDRISYEINPLSGLAKDLGSAAVLIATVIYSMVLLTILYVNF